MPEPTPEPAKTPASEPSKAKGAIVLSAARFLALITQLILPPVVMGILGGPGNGKVAWGICVLAGVFSGWGILADPGFQEGGLAMLLRSQSDKDEHNHADVWRTHLICALGHALFALGMFALVGAFYQDKDLKGDTFPIIVMAGFWYGAQVILSVNQQYYTATKQFKKMATLNASNTLVGSSMALFFTYLRPQPTSYIFGIMVGSMMISLSSLFSIQRDEYRKGHGKFDKGLAKAFVKVGIKGYPNRLMSMIAGSVDRVLLGSAVSKESLTNYDLSQKIPFGLSDLTASVRQTIQADVAKAHVEGEHLFTRAIDRYSRMSLAIASICILVPCGFGAPLLAIWLKERAYAGGAAVMLGMAIYRTMEVYFTCYGVGINAAKRPELMYPPIIWNSGVTLFATIPMVRAFGIEGLGIMNALIDIVLLVPFAWYMRRVLVPHLNLSDHLGKTCAILIVAGAWSIGAFYLMRLEFFRHYAILALPLIPIFAMLAGIFIFGLRLAPMPNSIARRLPTSMRTRLDA
ncbi:MAG: oligosaccharide flippase family protein [Armatimonadetes bacterium]|nr:oligosaccharide flippase family protein [Armatimonadota bacterium]